MNSHDNSYVIRKLTSEEISALKEELMLNDHLWVDHIPTEIKVFTALKDGRSIHLKFDKLKGIDTDHWSKFPHTTAIINEISNGKISRRTYWHRLLPGESIEKHSDRTVHYVRNNEIFARYQIYLDIPENSYLFMDDMVIEDKTVFENSIINFNLRRQHEYKNNSEFPWYFLVFDIMK